MPVRPPPRHYHCTSCGWHKRVAPLSDVLMPGDYPKCCPHCGHKPLESKAATALPDEMGHLVKAIERVFRSMR